MTTWADGYTAGHRRGQLDATAEHAGTWTRDSSHQGHAGEPPNLPEAERQAWIDGFLTGYAHGREVAA